MIGAIASRLLAAVPVLVVVILLSFLLVELSPGDPAAILAGEHASAEQVQAIAVQLGLDQSVWVRFGEFFTGLLQFDLGTSLFSGQSVTEAIAKALPVTLSLTLVAMSFTLLIAVPLGTLSAIWRGSTLDRVISAVCSFFLGVPPFLAALVLVIVLALTLALFPATGYVPMSEGFGRWLSFLVLPSVALALPSAAEVIRQLRGALVDVLEQDFIRTQRAKGLAEKTVVLKHALKNAAPPALIVTGLQVQRLLGGAVIVEMVFAMPGFGQLAYQAVVQHDYPMIQGVVLVSAVTVIVVNLCVDLIEPTINPKLRSKA